MGDPGSIRRVVTGVGEDGRSRVIADGPITHYVGDIGVLWGTDPTTTVASAHDHASEVRTIFGPPGSTCLVAIALPPADGAAPYSGQQDDAGWHATESVDYVIVVSGEVWCDLDDAQIHLIAGDVLVQTGTWHRWRNISAEPALLYAVSVGAPRGIRA